MSSRRPRVAPRVVVPALVALGFLAFALYVVIDAAGEDGPVPPEPPAAVALFVASFSGALGSDWSVTGPLIAQAADERDGEVLTLRSPGGALVEAGEASHRLPEPPWAVSLDLRLDPGSQARMLIGAGPRTLRLRSVGGGVELQMAGRRQLVPPAPGWPNSPWHHVELRGGRDIRVTVDGGEATFPVAARRTLGLGAEGGPVFVDNLLASPLSDPRGLLLHRLASLHARTPRGSFPLGTGRDGELRLTNGWTTGFWPGSLWQAADLTRASDLFRDWALEATLANLGDERADNHDLGFKYELSSVAAHRRLCQLPDQGDDGYEPADESTCARLKASGSKAARRLGSLIRSNGTAGTLPTRAGPGCTGCSSDGESDTIIDSAMNLPLLLWAARSEEDPSYRAQATRAARRLAALLVRKNGSTGQSVHFRRRTGAVLLRHTHQGLSTRSTWARGQGWAVHGFTQLGDQLEDPRLLRVAERAAGFVSRFLPPDAVPRYDYAAPDDAPRDTSAGVITAAGLLRLGIVCREVGTCREAEKWTLLGRRMLRESLRAVEQAPLGFFGEGVQTLGGRTSWDDDGELIFGLHYALEAIRLADGEGA